MGEKEIITLGELLKEKGQSLIKTEIKTPDKKTTKDNRNGTSKSIKLNNRI